MIIRKILFLVFCLVSGSANALNPIEADIQIQSSVTNMDVTVNPGGSGCPGGQYWDTDEGGCRVALVKCNQNETQTLSCSCSNGGSCSAERSVTYDVMGWRTPESGLIYSSPKYASIQYGSENISNSCVSSDDTPSAPSVSSSPYSPTKDCTGGGSGGGSGGGGGPAPGGIVSGGQLVIKFLVCGPSDLNYGSGPLTDFWKTTIIASYRNFNIGSRCPDPPSFLFWQGQIISDATWMYPETLASNPAQAYLDVWRDWTRDLMFGIAADNGEHLPPYLDKLNSMCTQELKAINPDLTGKYLNGSGNICIAD